MLLIRVVGITALDIILCTPGSEAPDCCLVEPDSGVGELMQLWIPHQPLLSMSMHLYGVLTLMGILLGYSSILVPYHVEGALARVPSLEICIVHHCCKMQFQPVCCFGVCIVGHMSNDIM